MVEKAVAAKVPRRSKDDISEKDEFHLPQIVSCLYNRLSTEPVSHSVLSCASLARRRDSQVHNRGGPE